MRSFGFVQCGGPPISGFGFPNNYKHGDPTPISTILVLLNAAYAANTDNTDNTVDEFDHIGFSGKTLVNSNGVEFYSTVPEPLTRNGGHCGPIECGVFLSQDGKDIGIYPGHVTDHLDRVVHRMVENNDPTHADFVRKMEEKNMARRTFR